MPHLRGVKWSKPFMRLVSVVVLSAIFSGSLFASSSLDFKISPDVTMDTLSIAATSTNYLVVWRDLRTPGAPQMRGSFVTNTGVPSADFGISDAAGQPVHTPVQRATTAFDGTNFLTVWADNRTSGAGIRAALISQSGAIAGGADFLVSPLAQMTSPNPLVIFTGIDYVVAWQDAAQSSGSAGPQIYFARVSLSGTVGSTQTLPVSPFSLSTSLSLEFLIAKPTNGNEISVVYKDLASSPNVTLATRIATDNSFLTPSTLLFKRDFSPELDSAWPIAAACDGTQYMILSSYGAQIDSATVFMTHLEFSGTVVRPNGGFAEVGQGTTGLAEDTFPRAIYNGVNEFLFVRNDFASATALHIMIERVNVNGVNQDPNPFLVDSATQGILDGGVAAAIGTQYLIVWTDGRRINPAAGTGNADVLRLPGRRRQESRQPVAALSACSGARQSDHRRSAADSEF